MNAPGPCIERINGAVGGSHKNPAIEHRGGCEGGRHAWKSKNPLELKLRRLFSGQAGRPFWLEACIGCVGPTIPIRSIRTAGRWALWRGRTLGGRENGLRFHRSNVLCNRFTLGRAQSVANSYHLPCFQRRQYCLPGHLAQGLRQRRTDGVVRAVALCTACLK